MDRGAGASGQASGEYVALLALVAVAFALASGLTAGGVGARLLAGMQRGLCLVVRGACPSPTPVEADLAPCPLERGTRTEELSETLGVVRLASSGTLSATRTSDGRVTVTLADGSAVGGEVGAGARLHVGHASIGGRVRGGASATWTSGRAWRFPSAAAARDFVARYGEKATIGGKLVDEVRSTCSLLCDAVGWRPHPALPPPDATYAEGGASAQLSADLGEGPAVATAGTSAAAVLGRRVERDGTRTWYLRLDGTAGAGLDLVLTGAAVVAGGEQVLTYTVDGHGAPVALGLQTAARLDGRGRLGTAPALPGARAELRGGAVVELQATLDLQDRDSRAAAHAALAALLDPRATGTVASAVAALARRIAAHGEVDRRTYALTGTAAGVGASVALGVELSGGFERTTEGLRLLSAETRLPGLPFLPRDDCRPA